MHPQKKQKKREQLLPEEEWNVFSTEESVYALNLFRKAKKENHTELPEEALMGFTERVEKLMPECSSIISGRTLSLILLELRALEYTQEEALMYKRIDSLGAKTKIRTKPARRQGEGWIYGEIKDLMRSRKKQVSVLAYSLVKALRKELVQERVYPWNDFYGYSFTDL